MADNNVIDDIKIKISANKGNTTKTIDSIASSLGKLKENVSGIGSGADGLTKLASALKTMSGIDATNIKAQVSALRSFSKIDFSNLRTDKLREVQSAINAISNTNTKDINLSPLVNSIRRLSGTDLSNFDADTLKGIADGVKSVATTGDVSDKVNRLVSSLARLASAGEKTGAVSKALPELGRALHEVVGRFASAGGIPDEINAFVSSIAQLANAGNKTGTTAEQLSSLSTALLRFFSVMQNASIVSDNTLRMTEALAQLASAGSRTGTATESVMKSMDKMGNTRLNGIIGALKELGNIFEKVAGKAKSAALKIFNALRQIGSARPSLQATASTIRNMIAAMIGFRGITGFASLLKQTIMLGANLTEIDHIVESVFGDMSSYVDQWAKNAITEFGIAEHSAKQYAGVLSSMFQASQIGYKDAGKMAMDLVGLAGNDEYCHLAA